MSLDKWIKFWGLTQKSASFLSVDPPADLWIFLFRDEAKNMATIEGFMGSNCYFKSDCYYW